MEEAGLLGQLGINWKLFLSQAFNFFILLIVLRAFVYKPLLEIIKKRNFKIKEGLEKAEEADVRLKEVDVIAKDKIKLAENQSVEIIKNTEQKAKVLDQQIQARAEEKQKEINELLRQSALKQKEESESQVYGQALELVKKIVAKTVELKPEAVDKALVEKAVIEVKKNEI
jgi:F-type H+-transporting ATPase subunit b